MGTHPAVAALAELAKRLEVFGRQLEAKRLDFRDNSEVEGLLDGLVGQLRSYEMYARAHAIEPPVEPTVTAVAAVPSVRPAAPRRPVGEGHTDAWRAGEVPTMRRNRGPR